jgi:hypothetical protein
MFVYPRFQMCIFNKLKNMEKDAVIVFHLTVCGIIIELQH